MAGKTLFALQLILLFCIAFATRAPDNDIDLLPGWGGDTYHPPQLKDPWMEVLDEDARIFLYHNFLSESEADHIRLLAEPRLARSSVVDTATGAGKVDEVRTSHGMFLARGETPILQAIEERIARWTLLPVGNGEGLQVLRYENGQKYEGHWDYFFNKEGTANGGNRLATVLMYLADVEEGGETVFPKIPAPGGENPGFSECGRYSLGARPKKGDAILFHSMKTTGELEKRSLHSACPVIKGTKWSAAKWIHVGHYSMGGEPVVEPVVTINKTPPEPRPKGSCYDNEDLCIDWADAGECLKNPKFMVGTAESPGQCPVSCKRCDLVLKPPNLFHSEHLHAADESSRRRTIETSHRALHR